MNLRVLHTVSDRNWGGTEQRILGQVEWLVSHGHAAWLAAPNNSESYHRAKAMGLPVLPMNFDRPWTWATIAEMRRAVRHHRIDVIDAHFSHDAKTAMTCLDRCAVVRTRHTDRIPRPTLLHRLQWRFGCDHVVSFGDSARWRLIKTGLADSDRVTGIGDWADDRFFLGDKRCAPRNRLRRELGLTNDGIVLLCAAMLRSDQGHSHFIHAMRLLLRRGQPVFGLLVGSACKQAKSYDATLKSLARGLGVEENMRFLGDRSDIPDLMQAADVVVIPSQVDSHMQSVAQAFAACRPLVATCVGRVPDVVVNGNTGWLVPPADPEALARAVADIISEPDRAVVVTANARRLAEATMRMDPRMRQTLEVYGAAVDHARARSLPILRQLAVRTA